MHRSTLVRLYKRVALNQSHGILQNAQRQRLKQNLYLDRKTCLSCTKHGFSTVATSATTPNRLTDLSNETIDDAPLRCIIEEVKSKIKNGELHEDISQLKAARKLARLQRSLVGYDNRELFPPPPTNQDDNDDDDMAEKDSWEDVDHENLSMSKGDEIKKEDSNAKKNTPVKNETNTNANDTSTLITQTDDDSSSSPPTTEDVNIMIPRGLFLHGQVGTGKSMLMDIFFQTSPIPNQRKQRVHFHSFMQNVHHRIHQLKQVDLETKGRSFSIDLSKENNPIRRVALQLSNEVSLLCFDEFQVTDIADALILRQLFEVLFTRGTVVVATSNRPPSDLYEGGLNRNYFLPFVDLLCRHCIVHDISSGTDYRLLLSEGMEDGCFFVAERQEEEEEDCLDYEMLTKQCDKIFSEFVGDDDDYDNSWREKEVILDVAFNRTLKLKNANLGGSVCRFHFDELCDMELGSSDYRAIAEQFDVVMLEKIPILTLKEHDRARRFITLVDELYEAKCSLVCSAEAPPDRLFRGEDYVEKKPIQKKKNEKKSFETKAGEILGIDVAQSQGRGVGELASVRELNFAFRRAASRLTEMCSKDWWKRSKRNRVGLNGSRQ